MHDNQEDFDLNDIIIYDLAEHIKDGGTLADHYLYKVQSDLFEYEDKISVNKSEIGIDIIQQISNNSGK